MWLVRTVQVAEPANVAYEQGYEAVPPAMGLKKPAATDRQDELPAEEVEPGGQA